MAPFLPFCSQDVHLGKNSIKDSRPIINLAVKESYTRQQGRCVQKCQLCALSVLCKCNKKKKIYDENKHEFCYILLKNICLFFIIIIVRTHLFCIQEWILFLDNMQLV